MLVPSGFSEQVKWQPERVAYLAKGKKGVEPFFHFGYCYLHLDVENDTTAIEVNLQGPLSGNIFIF